MKNKNSSTNFADNVAKVARAIQPKPVVVRLSDFKTNEYRGLKGGEKYEINEENPMLGWRGCSRYISKWYIEAFKLECQAIKNAAANGASKTSTSCYPWSEPSGKPNRSFKS